MQKERWVSSVGSEDAQRLPCRSLFGYQIGVHTTESDIFAHLCPSICLQPSPPVITEQGPVLCICAWGFSSPFVHKAHWDLWMGMKHPCRGSAGGLCCNRSPFILTVLKTSELPHTTGLSRILTQPFSSAVKWKYSYSYIRPLNSGVSEMKKDVKRTHPRFPYTSK